MGILGDLFRHAEERFDEDNIIRDEENLKRDLMEGKVFSSIYEAENLKNDRRRLDNDLIQDEIHDDSFSRDDIIFDSIENDRFLKDEIIEDTIDDLF